MYTSTGLPFNKGISILDLYKYSLHTQISLLIMCVSR